MSENATKSLKKPAWKSQPSADDDRINRLKAILFQGNFPPEYSKTRHNVGFAFADFLSEKWGLTWAKKPKFKAEIAELNIGGEKIIFIKPLTFYNETGFSARAVCDFYKINPKTNFLAICDDLDLNFGVIRTRQKGSSAGNNGLKSLIATFGEEFARVKIGIKNEILTKINSADFVLGKFSQNESEKLPQIFQICEDFVQDFAREKLENTKKSI